MTAIISLITTQMDTKVLFNTFVQLLVCQDSGVISLCRKVPWSAHQKEIDIGKQKNCNCYGRIAGNRCSCRASVP